MAYQGPREPPSNPTPTPRPNTDQGGKWMADSIAATVLIPVCAIFLAIGLIWCHNRNSKNRPRHARRAQGGGAAGHTEDPPQRHEQGDGLQQMNHGNRATAHERRSWWGFGPYSLDSPPRTNGIELKEAPYRHH